MSASAPPTVATINPSACRPPTPRKSWWPRLPGPAHALRRLVSPRRYGLSHLDVVDATRLELPCDLTAGWIRIGLAAASGPPIGLRICADFAEGSASDGFLLETPPLTAVGREWLLRLKRTVRTLRFEPLSHRDSWIPTGLQIEEVSAARVLFLSLVGKWRLLAKYGSAWRAVARGLSLLLRGGLRTFLVKLQNGLSGPSFEAAPDYDADRAYEEWQRARRRTEAEREAQRAEAAALPHAPLLSVVIAVPDEGSPWSSSVASVLRQTYPRWELSIAAGPAAEEQRWQDPRVRFGRMSRSDLAGLTNGALELASGEFVLFLASGDRLAEHALYRLAQEVLADPNFDLLYSDEDRPDAQARRRVPFFKPDWSPEYLLGCNYACRVSVLRTALVRELGGLREGFGGAAEYDLILRAAARTNRVRHIPEILYHARSAAHPDAADVGRALAHHLDETGRRGIVETAGGSGVPRVRFRVRGTPLVSIVIPSAFASRQEAAGEQAVVLDCVRSIRRHSTWPHYEVILVAGHDPPNGVGEALDGLGVAMVVRPGPFNFPEAVNAGAARASGTHLLLLNDDTEVLTPDWLESLLEYSQQPDIGAVGATLLFPQGRLQHAGVVLLDGRPLHAFYGYPGDHPGYFGNRRVPRNCSAVTGACLMTRLELFRELGGLDPLFPLNYNDIDYCLRVRQTGRRIVCTPYARLYHHEAFTKRGDHEGEAAAFRQRWGKVLRWDPYYNPNFSTRFPDYHIDPRAPVS